MPDGTKTRGKKAAIETGRVVDFCRNAERRQELKMILRY